MIPVKCWEYFDCERAECPVFESEDRQCWLKCGTHCHNEIQGDWSEKLEACLQCPVFENNVAQEDMKGTLCLAAEQFTSFKERLQRENRELREAQKKLIEFKKTSVYLLQELDKKSRELAGEKDSLARKVEEKTKDIRDMQEKLIHSRKMAALGTFAAGIAHEINNPLGGMLNCVHSLLHNSDMTGEKQKEYLELTLKGLHRVENTVSQILTFSDHHFCKLELSGINPLVQESLDFFEHEFHKQQVILQRHLAGDLPSVAVDSYQLKQVVVNVLKNAIDAMPCGGTLRVATACREAAVEISISDDGAGISEENLDKIYDPFFTTKEVGKGIGLGLSISFSIIQQHHGEIVAESRQGQGTTVIITLPLPD